MYLFGHITEQDVEVQLIPNRVGPSLSHFEDCTLMTHLESLRDLIDTRGFYTCMIIANPLREKDRWDPGLRRLGYQKMPAEAAWAIWQEFQFPLGAGFHPDFANLWSYGVPELDRIVASYWLPGPLL